MVMDETLFGVSERVKNFAVVYLVDTTQVPDFNKMYFTFFALHLIASLCVDST